MVSWAEHKRRTWEAEIAGKVFRPARLRLEEPTVGEPTTNSVNPECDCGHEFSLYCPNAWHLSRCTFRQNNVCLGFQDVPGTNGREKYHLCLPKHAEAARNALLQRPD